MLARFVVAFVLAVAALPAMPPPARAACTGSDCSGSLAYEAFGVQQNPSTMVVFLHGSVSAGGAADYMYRYARQLASSHPNVLAVALLAPGYYDRNGKKSDGSDGQRRMKDDTAEIIPALEALRARYKPKRIILVGHSKGAANMAGVLVKKPGLANGAVLVAGIYDPDAISAYRRRSVDGPEVTANAARIGKSARIILVHGDADGEVPIAQSTAFEQKARASGVAITLVTVSGAGHNFNGAVSAATMSAIESLIR